jgi:NADPH:quinone reductase-like Zn-dependent oxidoreductase
METLQYASFGEPAEVVAPAAVARPEPQTGEVRLRVLRSPIHNHDLATIRGVYGVKPQLPAIPGSECVGIVDACGDGVEHLREGQRVAVNARAVWAQFATVPARACVPVPDELDDAIACQLLAMPTSAIVLLDSLGVAAGDWVVQNAANGAIGRMLMRLAHLRGVNVVNLVRREAAAVELRELGAEHVIVTDDDNWPQRVGGLLSGASVSRVVDSVCDGSSIALQRLLGKHGEYVIFGALGSQALRFDPGAFIFNEICVRGFWMTAWMARATDEQRSDVVSRAIGHVLKNDLPLGVAGTYPLAQASTALQEAERSGRSGKVEFAPG